MLDDSLTFTTLWANSANDKLMKVFLFLLENRIWPFIQIVSLGPMCIKYQNLFAGEIIIIIIIIIIIMKSLPKVLSVKRQERHNFESTLKATSKICSRRHFVFIFIIFYRIQIFTIYLFRLLHVCTIKTMYIQKVQSAVHL